MRFCPFCAHENGDDAAQCGQCGRRLPWSRRPLEKAEGGDAGTPVPPVGAGPGAGVGAGVGSGRPDLSRRPAALQPKQPLRARAQVAVGATEPVISAPLGGGALGAASAESSGATPSGGSGAGVAGGLAPRRDGAAPLPPPPSDFAQLRAPALVRDATSPRVATDAPAGDERAGVPETRRHDTEGQDWDDDRPESAQRAGAAAALVARRGWEAVQRTVDVKAVRYVFDAARQTVRKKSEISRIRKEIVAEQQRLDRVLSELGREARAADLELPALSAEMGAVKALEGTREGARDRITKLEAARTQEEEQFRGVQAQKQEAIRAADANVAKVGEELSTRHGERAGYRSGMNRLDLQLRSLAKQMAAKDAAALRATEPAQQAAARSEAEALRSQVASLEPERARLEQKAVELDAPVAELEGRSAEAQAEAARQRESLAEVTETHTNALAQMTQEIERESGLVTTSDRELSSKFATLGTILNLNRIAGEKFDPFYSTFDECKRSITEKDEQIAALQAEIHSYDKGRLQKGVVVLVGAAALVIVAVVLLAWIF